jgi:zinc protease
MKKIFAFSAFLIGGLLAFSQSMVAPRAVPFHEDVLTGKLDNGLTYYILKNEKPQDKVEMRLVLNAGSILETDEQQGLAHFCEHMAFNGTKNFEKNELISTLQSNGVKFGAHLNAYTSFDETVYMLSLPTEDSVIQLGYQILEDWASNILFSDEEIEKERGVVLEEYRIGLGASKRMLAEYLPVLMANSQYVNRLPIGKKDVLETFNPSVLKQFYKDWYRPNLMAVVIVGNINPEEAEAQVKSHFSKLTNPKNAPARPKHIVPDHVDTRVVSVSDPEASYSYVQIVYKEPKYHLHTNYEEEYQSDFYEKLFQMMLNDRLKKRGEEVGAPYSYAYGYSSSLWARGKSGFQNYAVVSNGQYKESIKWMIEENARVQQHGFTQQELVRAISDMKMMLERQVKEKGKTESSRITSGLVSHFLENEPFTSPEYDLGFFTSRVSRVSLERINSLATQFYRKDNRVVIIAGPDKEKANMPNQEEVIELINSIENSKLDPYSEEALPDQLMERPTSSASVLEANFDEASGIHKMKLSNGVQIVYKHTEFKNDQIMFKAISKGGTSLVSDKDFEAIRYIKGSLNSSGLGEFDNVSLERMLAGKSAYTQVGINEFTESVSGQCRPEDLETLLQLVYLRFNNPRFDEESYERYVEKSKALNANRLANPTSFYQVEWYKHLYEGKRSYQGLPDEEDWSKSKYNVLQNVYTARFANPSDFTFVFIGNTNSENFIPLITNYLGSLEGTKKTEEFGKKMERFSESREPFIVKKGKDDKSMVNIMFPGNGEYDAQTALEMKLFAEVLKIRMTEVLREEMSGVYGSSAYASMGREPNNMFSLSISYPCGPEAVDTLIAATLNLLEELLANGVTDEDLNKVKNTELKSLKPYLESNRYWMSILTNHVLYGDEILSEEEMNSRINQITSEDLVKAGRLLVENKKPQIGILYPENWGKK